MISIAEEKEMLRAKIEEDVKLFLEAGGQIKKLSNEGQVIEMVMAPNGTPRYKESKFSNFNFKIKR